MVVNVIVNMENVMNNLTHKELKNLWDGQNNLINKPIFIHFYGEW